MSGVNMYTGNKGGIAKRRVCTQVDCRERSVAPHIRGRRNMLLGAKNDPTVVVVTNWVQKVLPKKKIRQVAYPSWRKVVKNIGCSDKLRVEPSTTLLASKPLLRSRA